MSRLREPRVLAATLLAALVAAALAVVLGPHPPKIGEERTGDRVLAQEALDALDGAKGHSGLAVARIEDGRVTTAGLGRSGGRPVTASTPFEFGSVTKVLSGMLLADAVRRDRVRLDQPVAELLPELRGTKAERITLAELASHRSGLPRLPVEGPADVARSLASRLTAGNPYADRTRADVVAAAGRTAKPKDRGSFAYSNLGASLLGHALAAADGTTYPRLLEERLLRPLRLGSTRVLAGAAPVPAGAAVGREAAGRRAEPWRGDGYAPAGIGTWSTAEDLGRLVTGAMDGTAPGADATRPRYERGEPGRRIGLGWMVRREAGQDLVWHNGGTGGFHSFVGFDRAARRGIVLLATGRSVDDAGLALLAAKNQEASSGGGLFARVWPWLTVAFALGAWTALVAPIRGRGAKADRLGVVTGAVAVVGTLVLIGAVGAWDRVPVVVFVLGAALAGAALALAAFRWPRLEAVSGKPRRRLAGAGLGALVWATVLVLVLA